MQHARGFIVGCANRVTLISWEAELMEQQIGQAFYRQKKPYYQHITYGLQSDWLHVCKAVLLVQTSRATCLQSNSIGTNGAGFCSNLGAGGLFSSPAGFYWVHIDWLAPGHPTGAGNPTISWETETQVPAACQPQPRQPHIIKLISQLQKTNKKNNRHMNYRHW